jgi:hypothetical protein
MAWAVTFAYRRIILLAQREREAAVVENAHA